MPAPEPPAAPNRPSDWPWPGPDPPGPEPPAGMGSARDGRVRVVAPVALDRGRDRAPGRRARGTPPAAPPPKAAGSAVAVERLGEQHVVVDVPAQRRRGGLPPRIGSFDRRGRRRRCRCEGRGRGLEGGAGRMRDGVALGRFAAGWSTAEGAGSGAGGGSGADAAGSGDGAGSGGGGGSGIGAGLRHRRRVARRVRRRRGLARDLPGRPPVRLPRAPARTRARTRRSSAGSNRKRRAVGLPTLGLGRTATSTERHLHLIGLKLRTRPCRGTQSPRERSYPRASGGCNPNAICNADCSDAACPDLDARARRRKWVCSPDAHP